MSNMRKNEINEDIKFEDFKEVKFLELKEKLTEDELAEGLEPMEEIFRVCITAHAHRRMYGEQERYCEYQWVENLLIDKSTAIMNAPSNEDIVVLADDKKMAVIISIGIIEGEMSISLISVIRNVIYRNGREVEVKNKSNTDGKVVI